MYYSGMVNRLSSLRLDNGRSRRRKKAKCSSAVLLDKVEPPMGYRRIHAANLTEWVADIPSTYFDQFLSDLHEVLKDELSVKNTPYNEKSSIRDPERSIE